MTSSGHGLAFLPFAFDDVRYAVRVDTNCVKLHAECRPPDPSAERRRSGTSSGTIVWRGGEQGRYFVGFSDLAV